MGCANNSLCIHQTILLQTFNAVLTFKIISCQRMIGLPEQLSKSRPKIFSPAVIAGSTDLHVLPKRDGHYLASTII